MKRVRISTMIWLIAVFALSCASVLEYRRAERLEAEFLSMQHRMIAARSIVITEPIRKKQMAAVRSAEIQRVLFSLDNDDRDKSIAALDPFQGEWKLVSLKTEEGERIKIDQSIGERLLIIHDDKCTERDIFVDADKKPTETVFFLHAHPDSSPIIVERGGIEPEELYLKGLAKFEGDRLVFVWDFLGGRPKDFEPGKEKQVYVYEKVKP